MDAKYRDPSPLRFLRMTAGERREEGLLRGPVEGTTEDEVESGLGLEVVGLGDFAL